MDTERARLADLRVGIVGLGLMGASLALDLRGHVAQIVGHDQDAVTQQLASDHGVIDHAVDDLAGFDGVVDLFVLAVPVDHILALLHRLPGVVHSPMVVLDLGSTKRAILAAMDALPERFAAVGGHPMCGKASGGFEQAEAGLYRNAPFALVRSTRTSARAWRLVSDLVAALEGNALMIDADAHDAYAAQVSHVPYLLACACALSVSDEASSLAGPGLSSVTRLAGTPLVMMGPVLATNRDLVGAQLEDVIRKLQEWQSTLAAGEDQALWGQLQRAASQQQRWASGDQRLTR